jgi:hypothetical protein
MKGCGRTVAATRAGEAVARPDEEARPLRLAVATVYDLASGRGIAEKMAFRTGALARACGPLEYLGPLSLGARRGPTLAKQIYYRFVQGKRYFPYRDEAVVRAMGRQLARRVAGSAANVVLSLEWNGSQPVAYLDCRQPIAIWTDATFAGTMETHPGLARSRLCAESIRDGLANERSALERASLVIYLSDWAAHSALRHYDLDPAKVRVVPGGANLESGLQPGEVDGVIAARPSDRCRLVFLGRRWHDKGGDLAVEVAGALNRGGLPTTLTVIGAGPPGDRPLPPHVHLAGPLRKSVPAELAQLARLLCEAHFLILPTRAEAFGLVFCEASAFALPSLASDVGGVASAVAHGRNGRLLPLAATAADYCAAVEELFRDYARYTQLARSSYDEYATRLNWTSAAASVRRFLQDLV